MLLHSSDIWLFVNMKFSILNFLVKKQNKNPKTITLKKNTIRGPKEVSRGEVTFQGFKTQICEPRLSSLMKVNSLKRHLRPKLPQKWLSHSCPICLVFKVGINLFKFSFLLTPGVAIYTFNSSTQEAEAKAGKFLGI